MRFSVWKSLLWRWRPHTLNFRARLSEKYLNLSGFCKAGGEKKAKHQQLVCSVFSSHRSWSGVWAHRLRSPGSMCTCRWPTWKRQTSCSSPDTPRLHSHRSQRCVVVVFFFNNKLISVMYLLIKWQKYEASTRCARFCLTFQPHHSLVSVSPVTVWFTAELSGCFNCFFKIWLIKSVLQRDICKTLALVSTNSRQHVTNKVQLFNCVSHKYLNQQYL